MQRVVDATFVGIETGRHYIHTHPDVSKLLLQSRVLNILSTAFCCSLRWLSPMDRARDMRCRWHVGQMDGLLLRHGRVLVFSRAKHAS